MKILEQYPPNYEEIKKAFDLTKSRPIFTYGDTVYNPYKASISPDLMVHEEVHNIQQSGYVGGSDAWWNTYISIKDKNSRYRLLHTMATDLSSAMYGHVISYTEAIKRIRDK